MKKFDPRPWQPEMIAHGLEHNRCALWAKPGAGKTSATLSVLDSHFMGGEDHPALILAPKRVARRTWAVETQKWTDFSHLDVMPIMGTVKEREAALKRDVPIYTTNYENLVWLAEHWGPRWPYRIIVADESTKLKSLRLSFQKSKTGKEFVNGQGGKRARALGKVAHVNATHFYELTGTPSPNGLADLWGQLWFLDRGHRLGRTFTAFTERWFRPKRDGHGIEPLPHAEAEIHDLVKDLCLTIDPGDWIDLDEPFVNVIKVDLPPAARRAYKQMEKDMFAELGDRQVEAFGAAAKTQKLLQFCNGQAYVSPAVESDDDPRSKEWRPIHDEKLDALEELLEEIGGEPVIVVYEFRSDLARLQSRFPEGRVLQTEKDEADFKAGKIPILFMHPQSGGHGIDGFQYVCNQMVFFSQNWNLEFHDQIIERIGPMRQMQAGMDRLCYLHYIVAENTVDEDVMERRRTKREVQDILLEAAKRRR